MNLTKSKQLISVFSSNQSLYKNLHVKIKIVVGSKAIGVTISTELQLEII